MNRIITVGLALLVAVTGVVGVAAALPGNAPDGVPADGNETSAETSELPPNEPADTNASTGNGPDEASTENRPGEVGPADGLPDQVPDFVGSIHETIVSEAGESLGETISGLTPDGESE